MIDRHAIAAVWAKTRRSVVEYAHVPDTSRPFGPCVVCRAVPVRTHRGVCRRCSAAERKP